MNSTVTEYEWQFAKGYPLYITASAFHQKLEHLIKLKMKRIKHQSVYLNISFAEVSLGQDFIFRGGGVFPYYLLLSAISMSEILHPLHPRNNYRLGFTQIFTKLPGPLAFKIQLGNPLCILKI